ncbi:hypothetical protein [Streptantibioticus cattleyicolor]|uniref:Uncharacterized protein n=1 Tax=Streptantibioticus cattleyicolor (strain ATCC 35852 / DSM 46488 / JCM 4925 / NBRC 14057 / NRRL 8057) TaxID=1003195 RepID=G8WRX0_STREN|nr:hypothetical protein [Streptantibioticus cattleyicolor]AEW94254.1 hypothetical protein SCATT_18830 [Streptantibioticus cattleyicolor NRRL 8057 = DSM 46488]
MDTWATWTTVGVIAGSGGVVTEEVGPITGDLTIHTTWLDGEARVAVQYTGAEEWFTLVGSPVTAPDERTGRAVHQSAVEAVREGGGSRLEHPAEPPAEPAAVPDRAGLQG